MEGRTGIAWLVNKLAAVGAGLKEGHIVLGGSFSARSTSPTAMSSTPTMARSGQSASRFFGTEAVELPPNGFKAALKTGRSADRPLVLAAGVLRGRAPRRVRLRLAAVRHGARPAIR